MQPLGTTLYNSVVKTRKMFPYEAYDVAIRNTYCMSPYEATSSVGMLDTRRTSILYIIYPRNKTSYYVKVINMLVHEHNEAT